MLAWLRLLRFSGLCTIFSNLLVVIITAPNDGLLVSLDAVQHNLPVTGLVVLASVLFYLIGMVWNDAMDLERDRELHPERPLPAGLIALPAVWIVGILLLAAAMVVVALLGQRGIYCGGLVLVLILLYNLGGKSVPWFGSLIMAAIRCANVCFAMLVLGNDSFDRLVLGFLELAGLADPSRGLATPPIYPLILFVYIFGLTLASEIESRRARRWEMLVSGLCMAGAVAAVWLWGAYGSPWRFRPAVLPIASLCLGALLLFYWLIGVGRSWWVAAGSCEHDRVGPLVGAGLKGIILLDAMAALAFSLPGGLAVIFLLGPFVVLSRLIRMD